MAEQTQFAAPPARSPFAGPRGDSAGDGRRARPSRRTGSDAPAPSARARRPARRASRSARRAPTSSSMCSSTSNIPSRSWPRPSGGSRPSSTSTRGTSSCARTSLRLSGYTSHAPATPTPLWLRKASRPPLPQPTSNRRRDARSGTARRRAESTTCRRPTNQKCRSSTSCSVEKKCGSKPGVPRRPATSSSTPSCSAYSASHWRHAAPGGRADSSPLQRGQTRESPRQRDISSLLAGEDRRGPTPRRTRGRRGG